MTELILIMNAVLHALTSKLTEYKEKINIRKLISRKTMCTL